MHTSPDAPGPAGLYDPSFEHDACGLAFVADIHGRRSHEIIDRALEALVSLQHRGACAEAGTGDGAGILIQMPDRFMRKAAVAIGITLPGPGRYASGLVFLPAAAEARATIEAVVARVVTEEGQSLLGWRAVPVADSGLGPSAVAARPAIAQVFIGADPADECDAQQFERTLYVIRRRIERAVATIDLDTAARSRFFIVSLSARTFIYKGMLTAGQIETAYPDLADPDMDSALALVHQRFSTNTFPSWPLAHPYRYVAHNGEINTLRGNINWMKARERELRSALFGDRLDDVLPVIREGGSDTATFDNVLELLVLAGRSLPHAVLMMIPEPWNGATGMDPRLRAFYEYHATLMEPWDGPAAMAFTDGTVIGATLDRNGLRPLRYSVTVDGLVVVASETGALDIPADRIVSRGRVQPGRMFLVDTASGRIVPDEEIKRELADAQPYGDWLDAHRLSLRDLPDAPDVAALDDEDLLRKQQMFGYTYEDLETILGPMATGSAEPIGSMGTDSALAVLSSRSRPLFDYFKQGFAQVTNPPLDAIREQLVTTLETTMGAAGNLLEPGPEACRRLALAYPVIGDADLRRIQALDRPGLRARTLSAVFEVARGGAGIEEAIARLQREAREAIDAGYTVLVVSDREADASRAPMPSLLAVSAIHHQLVRTGGRARCGLVVEAGDVREVHHVALLAGYGAGAINPYLACESLRAMARDGQLGDVPASQAVLRYVVALNKGILKVMSKMGISTLQSYCGAQIFEALGLETGFVEACFTGTPSRIGGIGIAQVGADAVARHRRAYRDTPAASADLDVGGEYQWRREGEHHLFTPEAVFTLQHATRSGQYDVFRKYTDMVDDQTRQAATLRGLFELRPAGEPVPLDAVEPVEAILKRFVTGAMSYGSLSEEAHSTLAVAMNRIGAKSNSGEGGEDPSRFEREANGDWRRSAVKQVASGRFGVTSEYFVNAEEIQIKMAQGAKPGEGGQLPGNKVYPWIAKVRHATPGVGLISPPPHHDIYSIEDLAQLIHDLRSANPRARISVKLVATAGVGTVAAGVAKAGADVVLISGHDGGTGAAPLTSIKHAGVPWELGLAEAQQVLRLNGLRGGITVQTDGQMKTGRDVVVAALLGAEEFGFATAPLVVSGCVMMRACHLNSCPVGVATQDPELRKRFTGRPEFVVNFFRFIAEQVREHMAALGFRTVDEMIGRVECLDARSVADHPKAAGLEFSRILHVPDGPAPRRRVGAAVASVASPMDEALVDACAQALVHRHRVHLRRQVRNLDRAVGTRIGYEITRRWGGEGLPDDTIHLEFTGSAGQSFGAFIPSGLTLALEGDANDYVGKGLSGGRVAVMPPRHAAYTGEENVIIGNVALYGATSGEAFIRGLAGERFAVRNSGALAVVEGVGDHGCEYMTGGRVVVLGPTGRNFAAGMSGGTAFVLDADGRFPGRCNRELVDLEPLTPDDQLIVSEMLHRHRAWTGSTLAASLLADWPRSVSRFVRVMPREYKAALEASSRTELVAAGLPVEVAVG